MRHYLVQIQCKVSRLQKKAHTHVKNQIEDTL